MIKKNLEWFRDNGGSRYKKTIQEIYVDLNTIIQGINSLEARVANLQGVLKRLKEEEK